MEEKRNLPRKSRKSFDDLSKKQKRLRHYAKFYATIRSSNSQLCKNDSMDVSESNNDGGDQTRNVSYLKVNIEHNNDDENCVNDNGNYVSSDNTCSNSCYTSSNDTSSNSCYDSQRSSESSGKSSCENNCTGKTYVEKEPNSFSQQLAQICCQTNMNHTQINAILGLLRSHECHSKLPKDARTLLKTPKHYSGKIRNAAPGQYLHVGIKDNIVQKLSTLTRHTLPSQIVIDISTDGANIYKSVDFDIWPIQFRINNIEDKRPMIAGLYAGPTKPKDFNILFEEFNLELLEVINNGILFNGKNIKVILNCFIADTPAKHACLNIKGHAGYNSCNKCKIPGERHKTDSKTIFKGTGYPPRTDREFREKLRTDDHHHDTGNCALYSLPLDLVDQTPLDYMHLICLGVLKQIVLKAWIEGKYRPTKLLDCVQQRISQRLEILARYCPSEFSRQPRSLHYYPRYKATECRQMLLYTGPTIFLDLFGDDPRIIHFLKLHYATRILISSDERPSDIDEANAILNSFVIDSISVYGRNFLTYNVHNLIHLANDVHKFGSLDHFSCFPFENNIMCFRKMVRKPSLQLQQIYNRYMENQNSGLKKFQGSSATIIYAYHQLKFTDNNQQVENVKLYYGIKIKGLNFNLQKKIIVAF